MQKYWMPKYWVRSQFQSFDEFQSRKIGVQFPRQKIMYNLFKKKKKKAQIKKLDNSSLDLLKYLILVVGPTWKLRFFYSQLFLSDKFHSRTQGTLNSMSIASLSRRFSGGSRS